MTTYRTICKNDNKKIAALIEAAPSIIKNDSINVDMLDLYEFMFEGDNYKNIEIKEKCENDALVNVTFALENETYTLNFEGMGIVGVVHEPTPIKEEEESA